MDATPNLTPPMTIESAQHTWPEEQRAELNREIERRATLIARSFADLDDVACVRLLLAELPPLVERHVSDPLAARRILDVAFAEPGERRHALLRVAACVAILDEASPEAAAPFAR